MSTAVAMSGFPALRKWRKTCPEASSDATRSQRVITGSWSTARSRLRTASLPAHCRDDSCGTVAADTRVPMPDPRVNPLRHTTHNADQVVEKPSPARAGEGKRFVRLPFMDVPCSFRRASRSNDFALHKGGQRGHPETEGPEAMARLLRSTHRDVCL
jgi:hypothetical protein